MKAEDLHYIKNTLEFALSNGNFTYSDKENAYNCLTNSINAIDEEILSLSKEPGKEEEKEWNITFGNHFHAGVRIKNNIPEIIGAVNGWGDGIDEDKIEIELLTPPKQ